MVREAALPVRSPPRLAVFQFRFVVDKSEASNESRTSLSDDRARRWMRWAMAIFYFVAGVVHLRRPEAFLPIMPDWVPAPREVVLFTGACEIAGALALLTRSLRWWAGVMLALYAVCVFPANIKHAVDNIQLPQLPTGWWYHAPRLLLQPVITWWALYCGEVVSWPFGRRHSPS
jgi:uncharacterized membrane protein